MTKIDLAAWSKGLDTGMVEAVDVLNGSARRAAELHWGVVALAESLRRNPDPEVGASFRSAETALDFVAQRLEDVWLAAQREVR
jgi:hypothetical protein